MVYLIQKHKNVEVLQKFIFYASINKSDRDHEGESDSSAKVSHRLLTLK